MCSQLVFNLKFCKIENIFSIHAFLAAKSIPESLQALRNNLAVDSACRNLVFADMYNALDLKQEAIRFIVYNISNVIQVSSLDTIISENLDNFVQPHWTSSASFN